MLDLTNLIIENNKRFKSFIYCKYTNKYLNNQEKFRYLLKN